MIGNFKYRGTSSLDYGLFITAPPRIPAPQRDEELIKVPGRDGVLRIDHGRYEAVTITYNIDFKLRRWHDVERAARGMKAWLLSGRGDYELADSYDTDYFRIASYSGPMDIENVHDWGGRFPISFLANPFKYSYLGQNPVTVGSLKTIVNLEKFESLPYIRIYGSGACELNLNNTTIHIDGVDGYVEIDSEAKQVFKDTTSMNANTTQGDFPVLISGDNHFDWNGNVSSVEIIPRWRTL